MALVILEITWSMMQSIQRKFVMLEIVGKKASEAILNEDFSAYSLTSKSLQMLLFSN